MNPFPNSYARGGLKLNSPGYCPRAKVLTHPTPGANCYAKKAAYNVHHFSPKGAQQMELQKAKLHWAGVRKAKPASLRRNERVMPLPASLTPLDTNLEKKDGESKILSASLNADKGPAIPDESKKPESPDKTSTEEGQTSSKASHDVDTKEGNEKTAIKPTTKVVPFVDTSQDRTVEERGRVNLRDKTGKPRPVSKPAAVFPPFTRDRRGRSENKKKSSFIAQNYKTEICRSHRQTGNCEYGNSCQFAHGIHELRPRHYGLKYKTQECKNYHSEGYCRFGSRCKFIHDEHRIRVATDEFWLVSPSENLVRVEVVENQTRQQELAKLISTQNSIGKKEFPAMPDYQQFTPYQGTNTSNVEYVDDTNSSMPYPSPTYPYQIGTEGAQAYSPYAQYPQSNGGVVYGAPSSPSPPGYYVQPPYSPMQSYSYGGIVAGYPAYVSTPMGVNASPTSPQRFDSAFATHSAQVKVTG